MSGGGDNEKVKVVKVKGGVGVGQKDGSASRRKPHLPGRRRGPPAAAGGQGTKVCASPESCVRNKLRVVL